MKADRTPPAFGFRDKLGYLFGDFGNDFTFLLSTTILLKFYTDVMGVSAAVVGAVIMSARFIDAFTDVTMGRICDCSRVTQNGKFRPWLLRMCGPVALSSFLIYQSRLASMPTGFKIAYLFVTYILWGSVFYTAINIPYGSMASAISAQPEDRQSLSTYRSMGATLAGTVIGVVVPLVAYRRINGRDVLDGSRVTLLAGIFSLLAIGCYLLCYFLTVERLVPESTAKLRSENSVGRMLSNAVRNRALLSIIAASVVMLLAQLTMQSMGGYVYPEYYNNAGAQSVSTVTMMAVMFAAAGLSGPLAARFGKAEISVVSNLFSAAVSIITFFLRPAGVWVFVFLQTLNWFGLGIFTMVSWALITDVIDYAELKNGIREDGSVYALYSFARKLGQAAAAGTTGALLSLIGYDTDAAAQQLEQTAEVKEGIFSIAALVPAVGFLLLALILRFWYPLHKKQVDANVAALKRKHET